MKKNILNKDVNYQGFTCVFLVLIFFSSCNPVKYVPQDETLLDKTHVIINKEGIKKSELTPYLRQRPNKQIFGTKFHLGLYNMSNINKDKWPHGWLREIGEEPVIYDPVATEKTKQNIQSYIFSKGYFDSEVRETIQTVARKSEVFYNVDLKSPYIIRNLYYEIADTSIEKLFYADSVDCMIERGQPYDVDILQAERSRFERFIRDHGFYGFSGDDISFRVDSTVGIRQVDIYYVVRNFQVMGENNRVTSVPHSMYRIRNVYIYPEFIPRNALEGGDFYMRSLDTTFYKGYYFISDKSKPKIKYDVILQSLYLKPGSLYNITNTEQSQSHLLSLKTFRLVNIFFNEIIEPGVRTRMELALDCVVQLTLLSQQSGKIELEGTNSAGNLGGAINLIYQHKNLLRGAETFNLKFKGAYEALSQKDTLRSLQEYGVETSLRLPKFLFPFLQKEKFIKTYNPTTTLLAAYNYQNMPFYTRTIANFTFGYDWDGKVYTSHIVNPVQLNLVNLLRIDPDYYARIDSSSYLAYSYRDVMILGGNYSYIFNNQSIRKARDYWFVRINAEAAGNMLGLVSDLTGIEKTEGSYQILGQSFAQYIRADIDIRYNMILNDVSSIVCRGFAGAGIPYGNSRAIPFEKQYYGGGANGIRAWQVRTLGPGSFVPDYTKFLNQTGDIKFEANIEYRFKLFWILNGALFLDAGNIWTFNDDPAQPGAQFNFNSLVNDLAIGTGAGLRFDLNFVILRADMGIKLRDPWIGDGSKWILMNRPYNFSNDFTGVIAIGYPF